MVNLEGFENLVVFGNPTPSQPTVVVPEHFFKKLILQIEEVNLNQKKHALVKDIQLCNTREELNEVIQNEAILQQCVDIYKEEKLPRIIGKIDLRKAGPEADSEEAFRKIVSKDTYKSVDSN